MAALNKRTGDVLWRTTGLTDNAQYASQSSWTGTAAPRWCNWS